MATIETVDLYFDCPYLNLKLCSALLCHLGELIHHFIVARVGDGCGKVISLALVEELNDGTDLDKVDCEFADEIKLFKLLQDSVWASSISHTLD